MFFFGIDPDSRSGTLEWLIVATLLVGTITLFALASYEWRKVRTLVPNPGVSSEPRTAQTSSINGR